jgi:hypothetical protein
MGERNYVSYIEVDMILGMREYGCGDPLRWLRDTLYP